MTISSWSDINKSSIKLFNNTLIRPVPSSSNRLPQLASSISRLSSFRPSNLSTSRSQSYQAPSLSKFSNQSASKFAKKDDDIEVIDVQKGSGPKSAPPAKPLSASERRWAKIEKEDEIGNMDKLLDPSTTSKPFFSQVDEIVQRELRKIKEGISEDTPESIKDIDPLAETGDEKNDGSSDVNKNVDSKKESETSSKVNSKDEPRIQKKNSGSCIQPKNSSVGQDNRYKFFPVPSQKSNNKISHNTNAFSKNTISSKTKDVLSMLDSALKPEKNKDKSNFKESTNPMFSSDDDDEKEDFDSEKEDADFEPRQTIASTRSRRRLTKVDYTKEAPRSLNALEKEKEHKQVEQEMEDSKEVTDIESADDDSRGFSLDRVTKELKANNMDIVQLKGTSKKSISRQDATKTVEESSDDDNEDRKESSNVLNMLEDSIKHLSPPKKPPTNREMPSKQVPIRRDPPVPSRNNPPAPSRGNSSALSRIGNVNISQLSDKKIMTVNRQNMINRSNMQSNLQRLKMQQAKRSANSDEIIALDDDEDDIEIEEVVKSDNKIGNNVRRSLPNQMLSSATSRTPIMPLKRKDPLSLDVSPRDKSPPRKRQEMMFKAPENKQSIIKPTERNVEKSKQGTSNLSLNKNISVRQVMTPGTKKVPEVVKTSRPGQPKPAPAKETSPVPERRTRGGTKQSSVSRSEEKNSEDKNGKQLENKRSRSQTKSQEREPSEPKSTNKTEKVKKDTKKVEEEKAEKSSKKSQKETKPVVEKKESKNNDKSDLLPEGWRRELSKRTRGAASDKPEVYIFSPEGKRFRSKKELQKYCKDNPKSRMAKIDLDAIYELGEGEQ